MAVRGKRWPWMLGERERSSGTKEVPVELRGRRVMTRLLVLWSELRARGQEPRTVRLSVADEHVLVASADETFGAVGAAAEQAGRDSFRAFLRIWFRQRMDVDLTFDGDETAVT